MLLLTFSDIRARLVLSSTLYIAISKSTQTIMGWPSGLNSFRQVTEVKLGRVRSNSGWVTSQFTSSSFGRDVKLRYNCRWIGLGSVGFFACHEVL